MISAKYSILLGQVWDAAAISAGVEAFNETEDVPLAVLILSQEVDVPAGELFSALPGTNIFEKEASAVRALAKDWDADEVVLALMICGAASPARSTRDANLLVADEGEVFPSV